MRSSPGGTIRAGRLGADAMSFDLSAERSSESLKRSIVLSIVRPSSYSAPGAGLDGGLAKPIPRRLAQMLARSTGTAGIELQRLAAPAPPYITCAGATAPHSAASTT